MSIVSIFADGVGLMIGSLLAAACLTFAAWWVADRMGRVWLAPVLLALAVAATLISPLEQSLFVRMLTVFGLVGAGLLWFVGRDGAVLPIASEGEAAGAVAFPATRDQ
jgi:hypothetical protein